MIEATITLSNVCKRYGAPGSGDESWAVRNVSFAVYPGELTVLMGPSGSGKTTALSMIGGVLDVTQGHLSVLGETLENQDEHALQRYRREKIGFVFQSYNLLAALTARENIEVALALRKRSRKNAAEVLASVGLADKLDAYPANLSGGQRQRVGIARALAGDPPILLADEPTAALDAAHGRSVMELLRNLAKDRGRTVLVVTHDPRVRELSDRVIDMEDGGLKQIVRRTRLAVPGSLKDKIAPGALRLTPRTSLDIFTKQSGVHNGTN